MRQELQKIMRIPRFGFTIEKQHEIINRDKAFDKFSLATAANIKIADNRKNKCADKIDKKILHGIQKSDVQIAAKSQFLSVDYGGSDIVDGVRTVASGGVQGDGTDGMDDGIFLHVQSEKHIHAAFKEFPNPCIKVT